MNGKDEQFVDKNLLFQRAQSNNCLLLNPFSTFIQIKLSGILFSYCSAFFFTLNFFDIFQKKNFERRLLK